MPGGLGHVVNAGDVLQLAFGFRDRVPGYGRQMDDPYAWKGAFYDTDACYVAHASTDGDHLIRLWGPATSRRNGYQTEPVPGLEAVPGGTDQDRPRRDRPGRRSMSWPFPAVGAAASSIRPPAGCDSASSLYDNELPGEGNGLNWSDAAGVFDHWRNSDFLPADLDAAHRLPDVFRH